ncbi:tRNA (adenosine(37)-N6)-threonylcarbamoyltransferase complex dimerization subunit type 1 TsaB [Allofustis seminis]|uniref:tRNA (adenosine(37)-N6)-threonylcarbamoyltransferase complex dimerization subunit type 1 TsaB n=1 Tax=Allofustis seminis TaxID=166939 RepID=UPI0003A85A7D|nr:tRNA (adenosine(37)-N6)-threonylcarbamoyltransferase complex dimerization subunit type 1 TsaB [Allofustis seminis]
MKILAFDTSNTAMSVAVVDGQQLLAEKTVNVRKNHSIQLMPTIDLLLQDAKWTPQMLERIVVAEGPGSYTGLRIAATTAKTLAWTLGIDLVGVSSLQVLAQNAAMLEGQWICPLFDARRGNFYTGLYRINMDGQAVVIEPDTHIALVEWLDYLAHQDKTIYFVGEDAWKIKDTIKKHLADRAYFSKAILQTPDAWQLSQLGACKEVTDIHTFVPQYLKLAEAEANWLARHTLQEGESLVDTY